MNEPILISIQDIESSDLGHIYYRNLGYSPDLGAYVSEFSSGDRTTYSVFSAEKFLDFQCPDPAMRLSFDQEHLEIKWGATLHEACL